MRFLFEGCSLDTDRRELRRNDILQPVEPQVLDLLEFLIRNRQRVVTKHDILASVWGGRIVSDSALNSRLNAARSAIGDSGRSQHLIKTLLRKGLRFVGTVNEQDSPDSAGRCNPLSCASRPSEPRAPALHPQVIEPPSDLPSIAVLPFRSIGSDEVGAYFGDGIVEDILVSLASLRELFVISRGSTLALRDRESDLREVGRSLGVRYLVTGSVGRSGKKLRVWVELWDVGTAEVIWSERIDAAMDDLFDVQDQIVADTVSLIAPHVRQAELKRALRKQPETFSAYDCMLRGIDLILRHKQECFEQALQHFRKARLIEPTFALPYAWAAWAHTYRVGMGWSRNRSSDIEEGTHLAEEALHLDSRNARALATYGHVKSFCHHDWDAGLQHLSDAVRVCPNDPFSWALKSASASYIGCGPAAVSQAERALRLSPYDTHRFYYLATLGLAYYVNGQYDEAVRWGRISLRENPVFTPNLRYLAASLAAADRTHEAKEVGRSLIQHYPGFALKQYESSIMPFQGDRQRQLHLAHLRQAGLPDS